MKQGVFTLVSKHKPAGDQPAAIRALVSGLQKGYADQTLLGVTGSGKTFTIAHVIQAMQKPTLVIAHNKTLAAQLRNEFRMFFPHNAVHYFVSYYDYYQPEAYIPATDTYIGKEAMINDEIDRLRHAATTAVLTRPDTIIVASVSSLYGLGDPETYRAHLMRLSVGDPVERGAFARELVRIQFKRTSADLTRGSFRLRGDLWELMPAERQVIYQIEVESGHIARIWEVDPVKGFERGVTPDMGGVYIAPARHFITEAPRREAAAKAIKEELTLRLAQFEKEGKYLEAERLERRTLADLTMMREVGYCSGIENYSRHLSGRNPGEPPATLLDYFHASPAGGSAGFLTVIDESHVTVPQLAGMYAGDRSRKQTLIEHGFRLPSAADNRPLTFDEFNARVYERIYTSATPAAYEKERSEQIVEQIIRPTGLVDPALTVLPARGQVQDLIPRIRERAARNERVLVTTLTKRMAEDLSDYLQSVGKETLRQAQGASKPRFKEFKVAYLHSDVKTLDRIRTLTKLRRGEYDVLVGVNLLREGLDLPEVSLVAILDADKEGFLRSETSLIQVMGRAARNVNGEVVMYADIMTGSMKRAISETGRRRIRQLAYNKEHGITPRTIEKEISDIVPAAETLATESLPLPKTKKALKELLAQKEVEMREAAERLDFELAAVLRDEIKELQR